MLRGRHIVRLKWYIVKVASSSILRELMVVEQLADSPIKRQLSELLRSVLETFGQKLQQ